MASTTGLAVGMEITGTNISVTKSGTVSAGNLVTLNAHGLDNDQLVSFNYQSPTPYASYYVVNSTTNTFQVSATVGGSVITLTNGTIAILYPVVITSITTNTSINISAPASATGSVTTSSGWLKRSIARLRGYSVT
jgi:hypothetical protein